MGRDGVRATLLSGWYVLALTNAPHVVLAWASPLKSARDHRGFPCAGHGCGCITLEVCRARCCCFPRRPPLVAPELCCTKGALPPVKLDAFLVGRCGGDPSEGAVIGLKQLQPHVPLLPGWTRKPLRSEPLPQPGEEAPSSFSGDPPQRVPI